MLRDIMFGGRRHYLDLLENSEEGISTSVLADRLKKLTDAGVIQRVDDETHKQRTLYGLTEIGIALAPALMELSKWSMGWRTPSEKHAIRTTMIAEGGQELMTQLSAELRRVHLGSGQGVGEPSILAQLQDAFEAL